MSGVKWYVFFAYLDDDVAELDCHEVGDGGWIGASDYDACSSRLHEVAVACANAEQERDELRAQVEAMRRLLADEHLCGALTIICQLGVVERCRCWSCRMKRIDDALQTNP